jgi:hypothetical protein
LSWGALIPQTSLGIHCSPRTTRGHCAHVRKGSTWYMADGLMTMGNARPLRAPSLGTGGEGELLEAAGGDTMMLVYTRKSDSVIPPGRGGGARG